MDKLASRLAKSKVDVSKAVKCQDYRKVLERKDVDAVVDVVAKAGIAKKVARLRPVVVIKG